MLLAMVCARSLAARLGAGPLRVTAPFWVSTLILTALRSGSLASPADTWAVMVASSTLSITVLAACLADSPRSFAMASARSALWSMRASAFSMAASVFALASAAACSVFSTAESRRCPTVGSSLRPQAVKPKASALTARMEAMRAPLLNCGREVDTFCGFNPVMFMTSSS